MKTMRNWIWMLLIVAWPAITFAAADSWNSLASGKWEIASNWSSNTPSLVHLGIFITNGISTPPFLKTVNINSATVASNSINGCMTISNLTLSAPGILNNILFLENAGLLTSLHILNSLSISNGGNLSISNSLLQMDGQVLNFFPDDGSVFLNTGTLITTNMTTAVGYRGHGSFAIQDGTWLAGIVGVTFDPGSAGTLTVAGGTVTLAAPLAYLQVGSVNLSTGTLWLTGGRLTVTNNVTEIGLFGSAQAAVSNGTWQTRDMLVGTYVGSRGTLTLAGGTNLVSSLSIGYDTSSTGAVWLTDGIVSVGNDGLVDRGIVVGESGAGQMTVSNGICTAPAILIASNSTAQGTLTVNGGTLATPGPFNVGRLAGGTGTVWITGGQLVITNTPATVSAGSGFVVDGSVTLTNGSSIIVSNVNTVVGNIGSGSLTVFGGSLVANSLTLIGGNGVGTVTQLGGLIVSGGEILGFNPGAQGTLTVAGGTHTVAGGLALGDGSFAAGAVWVTGGQLVVTNNSTTLLVGVAGVGQLTLSNGTIVSRNADVGVLPGGWGTFTTAGGSNTVLSSLTIGDNATTTGAVWVTGGRLAVTNSINVGRFGIGQMTISNGTAYSANVLVAAEAASQGTFTAAGGATSINSTLLVGTLDCSATGRVIIAGGSLFTTNAAHTAVLEVRSGSVQLNSGTLRIDKLVLTNVCGHFIKAGGTLSITTTNLDPNLSAVGDGIPNTWKQQYGFDPFDPTVANADPDGDGCNNLCEFLAGSNPLVAIKSISQQGNDIRITWQAAASKTNALQRSPGDANGSYSNNFTDIFIITNSVGTVTNYLDVGAATNSPARYYRVRLVP